MSFYMCNVEGAAQMLGVSQYPPHTEQSLTHYVFVWT